jgi:hypothetical protein
MDARSAVERFFHAFYSGDWIVDGHDVSALHEITLECPRRTGTLTTGGWFTVTDGRVSSGRLIYDSAEFAAILAPT